MWIELSDEHVLGILENGSIESPLVKALLRKEDAVTVKWLREKIAMAEGKTVQYFRSGSWYDCTRSSSWASEKYRIKPDPKTDVVRYLTLYKEGTFFEQEVPNGNSAENIKIIRDGGTGELKSCEVLSGVAVPLD